MSRGRRPGAWVLPVLLVPLILLSLLLAAGEAAMAAPAPLYLRIGLAWNRWAAEVGGRPTRGIAPPAAPGLWPGPAHQPAPGGREATGAPAPRPPLPGDGEYLVARAGLVSAMVATDSHWLARSAAALAQRAARASGQAAPWRGGLVVSRQGPTWYVWLAPGPAAAGQGEADPAAIAARLGRAGWPSAVVPWPVPPGSPVLAIQGLTAVGLSGPEAGVLFAASSPVGLGPAPLRPGAGGAGAVTHAGLAYRGRLEVAVAGEAGLLSIVNPVDAEDYLLGVVATEMPASWPLEALKAQAVAARTYAVRNLGRHAAHGFDLCFDIHCQAYGGIAGEHPNTTVAVRRTAGIVATYNRRPINAVYHAHAGGATDASQLIWGAAEPYLAGTARTFEQPFNWTATSSRPEVEAAVLRALGGPAPAGAFPALRLVPRHFTPGRRAMRVDVTGPGTTTNIASGPLRHVLGSYRLRSANFQADLLWLATGWPDWSSAGGLGTQLPLITWAPGARGQGLLVLGLPAAGAAVPGPAPLPPAVAAWLDPAFFVFSGQGFGHGVGMSQWGAREMAVLGRSYREILTNFYQGITLSANYGR